MRTLPHRATASSSGCRAHQQPATSDRSPPHSVWNDALPVGAPVGVRPEEVALPLGERRRAAAPRAARRSRRAPRRSRAWGRPGRRRWPPPRASRPAPSPISWAKCRRQSRLGRSGRASYAARIRSRNAARMMQPPRQSDGDRAQVDVPAVLLAARRGSCGSPARTTRSSRRTAPVRPGRRSAAASDSPQRRRPSGPASPRGGLAQVGVAGQRAGEDRLGDAGDRHAQVERDLHGPAAGALLLGLVRDDVDEGLARSPRPRGRAPRR